MSIHVFFFWIQIYMATDFKSVCGRRSTIGHLIKTKAGKMFLQQSSKGENSTKREIKQNGILTKPLPSKIIWHVCFSFPKTVFCQLQGNISMLFLSKSHCVDYFFGPAIWINGFANLCIFQLVLSTSWVLVSTLKNTLNILNISIWNHELLHFCIHFMYHT